MKTYTQLKQKIEAGKRISPEEACMLFSWDLLELFRLADQRRRLVHPSEEVGFVVDRIINFSNVCEAKCRFCAFHAEANRIEPYEMTDDEIFEKIAELEAAGGTQVMLQGGLHPEYTLDRYVALVKNVKARFPAIWLHSFSPAELVHMSRKSRKSLDDVVLALKEAGLGSVPGASDLLVERIRAMVSPHKITIEQWCDVIDTLYRRGMASSATMTYGMGETIEERVEHLRVIRDVQDRTGILRAFIPWSFSPAQTDMAGTRPATGLDYLTIVAVARIYLDNVTYIQAGWLTEGLDLAQLALAVGANDMGGVLTEEVVVKATGVETKTNVNELIDVIRNAGKVPAQRDSNYFKIREF